MFGEIGRWRARRLGRKTIRRLYPELIRRYGKDERYTPGQVERALKMSGLGRRYRPYAHAVFTKPDEVAKLEPGLRRRVDPLLARDDGIAAALHLYALAILPALGQAAYAGDAEGSFGGFGDTGGGDAGAGGADG